MEIKEKHKKGNGEVYYTGKQVKVLKDYGNWVLVQYPAGYKEGINKQDLGLVKIREYNKTSPIIRGTTGLRV